MTESNPEQTPARDVDPSLFANEGDADPVVRRAMDRIQTMRDWEPELLSRKVSRLKDRQAEAFADGAAYPGLALTEMELHAAEGFRMDKRVGELQKERKMDVADIAREAAQESFDQAKGWARIYRGRATNEDREMLAERIVYYRTRAESKADDSAVPKTPTIDRGERPGRRPEDRPRQREETVFDRARQSRGRDGSDRSDRSR